MDATGQLVSDSAGTDYVYDQAGNLLSTSLGHAYEWDDYGRLIETTIDGNVETYGYDATSVRTSVGADAQLWDRTGLPTLINDSNNSYIHDDNGILRSDNWLLTDAVGSVRNTTSETGAVTGTSGFTAFGEPIDEGGTFGFAGEQTDTTGLIHLRARQLDPTLGRFLSVDPIQPGGPSTTGWNHYTYAGANPTTWTDPTGEVVLTGYALLNNREPTLAAVVGDVGLVLSTVLYTMSLCLAGYADCGSRYNFDFPNYDLNLGGSLSSSSSAGVVAPAPIQPGAFDDLVSRLQQELSTLSKATVKGIAATCVAQMVASSFADFEGICSGDRDPIYIAGAADLPGVSRHIGTNLITRPFNASLTRRTPTNSRGWLRSQAECSTSSRELFCDEFPFATTSEGGRSNYPARVSLQIIRRNENNGEGGILNGFYRRCGLTQNGERFFVASSNSPALPGALSLPTIYFGPSGCLRPGFG